MISVVLLSQGNLVRAHAYVIGAAKGLQKHHALPPLLFVVVSSNRHEKALLSFLRVRNRSTTEISVSISVKGTRPADFVQGE